MEKVIEVEKLSDLKEKVEAGTFIRYKKLRKDPPVIRMCPVCGGNNFEETERHNCIDPCISCENCGALLGGLINESKTDSQ